MPWTWWEVILAILGCDLVTGIAVSVITMAILHRRPGA
jgi:hypothetical protein